VYTVAVVFLLICTTPVEIGINMNLGCYEINLHKSKFEVGFSKIVDEELQYKLQWLQDNSANKWQPSKQ
jgi:hypothetical protein